MTAAPALQPATGQRPGLNPAEIDASCRLPLFLLLISAAIWLVIASILGLIASIKFHSPDFLADSAWLTYGRVRPAYWNALLYGFCLPAGFSVGLWAFARLGRTLVVNPGIILTGAAFWNLGVTVGVMGILGGDATGFAALDMPLYAAVLVMAGYLLMGIWAVLTFHRRQEVPLFVSQWFFFTALFWFPWIYSTATLLLGVFPARGVAQTVIQLWYVNNLEVVWLGLAGLAAIHYFVPRLLNVDLYSRGLSLFTYWILILFGSWGGIAPTTPVPAWLPAISAAATALTLIASVTFGLNLYRTTGLTLIASVTFGLNLYRTLGGKSSRLGTGCSLPFLGAAAVSFIVAALMRVVLALADPGQTLGFSWFVPAARYLQVYGFFAMAMFGAAYAILPQLVGMSFPRPGLVRAHFWLALGGVALIVVPWAAGGIVQAAKLQDARIAFVDISKATLPFLRASTVGDLAIAVGHLLFFVNLTGLASRFIRARAVTAYSTATADLFAAEAKT